MIRRIQYLLKIWMWAVIYFVTRQKCEYRGCAVDCYGKIKERHRNTAFHYDEERMKTGEPNPNLLTSCEGHYQEDYDRYQELWDEYWSGRL